MLPLTSNPSYAKIFSLTFISSHQKIIEYGATKNLDLTKIARNIMIVRHVNALMIVMLFGMLLKDLLLYAGKSESYKLQLKTSPLEKNSREYRRIKTGYNCATVHMRDGCFTTIAVALLVTAVVGSILYRDVQHVLTR